MLHHQFNGPEDAPVLVLSNSLGTDLHMWDAQVPPWSTHFRVLRYDTRGHGQSVVSPGPYSMGQLAQDVVSLLDALGIERVHFCGLSLGGMTGIWLGIHFPQRLHKLVLCNTAARIGTAEVWKARIETVQQDGVAAIVPGTLERWFTPAFRQDASVARIRDSLLAVSQDGYLACCAAVRDMDERDRLAAIQAPTLVVSGRHDLVTPPADGHAMASTIPGARYVELEAAHLSNLEDAARLTSEVDAFLLS